MEQLETLLRLFCRLRLRIGFASCIAIVPTYEPLLQADGASLMPAPFTMTILKEEVSAFGEDDLLDIAQPSEACTIDLCYANRVGVDHVIGLAPGIDDGVRVDGLPKALCGMLEPSESRVRSANGIKIVAECVDLSCQFLPFGF